MVRSSRPGTFVPKVNDVEIGTAELDQRQAAYKAAVDAWKKTIQREEDLASVEHSVADLDRWEQAYFAEEDARKKTREAKKVYEDGLRSEFFGFQGSNRARADTYLADKE